MKEKNKILKLSKIFEDYIDDHEELEHVGSGMMLDKNPERDVDVRYKGKDYLLTISKIQLKRKKQQYPLKEPLLNSGLI